ncbi:MAG: sulfatase [Maioricimonas sp. JB049]
MNGSAPTIPRIRTRAGRIEALAKPLVRSRLLLTLVLWICCTPVVAEDEPPQIRNVLFLVSDDLKASVLGCYGDDVANTPNIDRLAREGVVFRSAYCQGTVCAPSRISFMYSRYRGSRGETIGEHLQDHGLYTARVGKIFHMKVPGDIIAGTNGRDVPECWTERFNSPGLEAHTPGEYACLNLNIFTTDLEGRQSTAMPHRMFVSVRYDGDGSDQPDHKSATKAIELLRQHRNEPFFLAVGFVRPHYPMVAPQQYFAQYDWQQIQLPEVVEGDLDDIPPQGIPRSISSRNGIDRYPDNQKRMWEAYNASVTFMDDQVGRVLDELERLGLRESTAIVFTSDHGYHLGEHTFWLKNNLHEEVIRVPLVMSVPGYEPGESDSIVELVDIAPTLCDLLGLPVPESMQGVSLVPVLKNKSATVKEGALSFAGGTSWRTDDWAYMRYNDSAEELYDMKADPKQFTNLAGDPQHQAARERLAGELTSRLRAVGLEEKAGRR